MNIVQESTGELTAVLKVKVEPNDYQDKVNQELKVLQKKAQMPGFRPGKVPIGLVKKMYLKNIMAEQVNKILNSSLYEYIEKNKLNVLGNPLPNKENEDKIDFEKQSEFEFSFDIGLAPDIDLELNEDIEVEYHKITIDDEMLQESISNIRKQNGKTIEGETVEKDDIVEAKFEEIDGEGNLLDDGHSSTSTISIAYIKDEETKEKIIGSKAGDTHDIDIEKTVENETEMSNILNLKKEELDQYGKNYRFTIQKITRIEDAQLNEELFKKIAPNKEIKDEESFREFIRGELEKNYQQEVDRNFKNDASKTILEKLDLNLPEEFLKRWILETNTQNEKLDAEQVEKDFVNQKDAFKWQLIQNHLIKKYDIKISQEELMGFLRNMITQQFMQYGYNQTLPDDVIDNYAKTMLENKEQMRQVYDQLYDLKITDLFKEKLKLNEKEISYNDFVNLMTEKYKKLNPDASSDTDQPDEIAENKENDGSVEDGKDIPKDE
ncbi:MAG: trigger factor [Bacteroidota bacterium]